MSLQALALVASLLIASQARAHEPHGIAWTGSAQYRSLSSEERVAAQRAIEEVYWRYRIWPKENPTAKPPLDAVMPDSAIRAKVEDYLTKSNALETWWQRPITREQLQAELNRMAAHSNDGQVLQELFDALGNDAHLIAETLARQTLAERLIRNRYASDERFHGELRQKVEDELAACHDVTCMKEIGGIYRERRVRLHSGDVPGTAGVRKDVATQLDAEQWGDYLTRLETTFGVSPESIPAGRRSGLEETAEAYVITAVLSRHDDEIVTARTSWPKRSFNEWWEAEGSAHASTVEDAPGPFTLPVVDVTGCVNDTWRATFHDFPDARLFDTAIWTGTEMIVWGGGISSPEWNTGGRYNPATDTWMATSIGDNVPRARDRHSAVWTGTEMIVWGGSFRDASSGSTRYLNSGGRYDPTTDRWRPTSTASAIPTARFDHTAVWTGREMIVWGGSASGGRTNGGGRYDPAMDRWRPTSVGSNVPTARIRHTAVWTGTEMIVWGGNYPVLNTGGRYNPTTDRWEPTSTGANVPQARFLHTAVWTGTEMIVWGGHGEGLDEVLNSGGRYDPSRDSWEPTSTGANVPHAREHHTAVWTGTEMIVWGGVYYDSASRILDTGGRYDPAVDRWEPTSTGANVPQARFEHTAVWTGGEMIVWGGFGGSLPYPTRGGRYDPVTDRWTPTSTASAIPTARFNHTAVWTGAEMIVWGGGDISNENLATGGRYVPSTDSWTPTSTETGAPSARSVHTAVWTGTEMIVWGGVPYVGSGGRYDPTTDRWTPTSTASDVPTPRSGHTAVWTGAEMIVWGGRYPPLGSGGRYDPTIDRWTPTSDANAPAPRSGHTAVWTGREMIVWGGTSTGPDDSLNTGGRYDPRTDGWTPTSMGANVPSARSQHTAVWTGTEMIVWGGRFFDGTYPYDYMNDGRLYDPGTDEWVPTSTGADVPEARAAHTAVWTGKEMIVWGGVFWIGRLSTGGRYDPLTDQWSPTSTGAGVPSARNGHTAVWTGKEMIVWGSGAPTSTGARYCACSDGRIVYRDADGDGYGTVALPAASCDGSIPAGHAADGMDCDDSDANVHPGAHEACNGIDDDCNGVVDDVPAPPIITVRLNPQVLWPPNGAFRRVVADVSAKSACLAPAVATLQSITSNFGTQGIAEAAYGTPDFQFLLRAQGPRDTRTRIYRVTYAVTDGRGNIKTITTDVFAPASR